MDRQKRMITKPVRYQTTSSDEEGPRSKRNRTSIMPGFIDNDINDIRTMIEKQDYSTSHNKPQTTQTYTQQYIQTPTHTQQNIQASTHVQQHIETPTHAQQHIQTSKHTQQNIQAPTHIQHIETPIYTQRIQTPTCIQEHVQAPTHLRISSDTRYIPQSEYIQPIQTKTNFTLHTENDNTYYTNEILPVTGIYTKYDAAQCSSATRWIHLRKGDTSAGEEY